MLASETSKFPIRVSSSLYTKVQNPILTRHSGGTHIDNVPFTEHRDVFLAQHLQMIFYKARVKVRFAILYALPKKKLADLSPKPKNSSVPIDSHDAINASRAFTPFRTAEKR